MELDLFLVEEKVDSDQLHVLHVPAMDQYVGILAKAFLLVGYVC